MHQNNAWLSAQGLHSIISAIRRAPVEPGMQLPQILVAAPPQIQAAKGAITPKFKDAEVKSLGLAASIKEIAETAGCAFFDVGKLTTISQVDGVHLDNEQHRALGLALAREVKSLLAWA